MSDSKGNSFLRCGQAYYYAYHERIKIKPSWAIRGRSSHAAEEANYRQKMDTHVDMSLGDVQEIAANTFDNELKNGKEEVLWGDDEKPGDVKDQVVDGVTVYHLNIAPAVQPVMVEEKVETTLPWGTPIMGVMDVVDQNTAIRDTKHAAYAPRDGETWYGTQPGLYGWYYREATGEIPRFFYDYVVLGRKNARNPEVKAITIEAEVNEQRINLALRRLKAVEGSIRAAMKSGDFPANPSPFNCNGCGYRKICPYAIKK
jgi:hypothetical protein